MRHAEKRYQKKDHKVGARLRQWTLKDRWLHHHTVALIRISIRTGQWNKLEAK